MATTIKRLRDPESRQRTRPYRSTIQLSDGPLGKYDTRKLVDRTHTSDGSGQRKTLFRILPLGLIVLMATVYAFQSSVTGTSYGLLILLVTILVAVLSYFVVSLFEDGNS